MEIKLVLIILFLSVNNKQISVFKRHKKKSEHQAKIQFWKKKKKLLYKGK